jgi:hypothetical protein
MSRTRVIVTVGIVAVVAVGGYIAFTKLSEQKAVVDSAAGSIQGELDSLDPVTRAAVVAKLSTDAAKEFRARS